MPMAGGRALLGWLGGSFNPISPTRKVDTRDGTGTPQAQIPAWGSVSVQVTTPAGSGLVPEESNDAEWDIFLEWWAGRDDTGYHC